MAGEWWKAVGKGHSVFGRKVEWQRLSGMRAEQRRRGREEEEKRKGEGGGGVVDSAASSSTPAHPHHLFQIYALPLSMAPFSPSLSTAPNVAQEARTSKGPELPLAIRNTRIGVVWIERAGFNGTQDGERREMKGCRGVSSSEG